MSRHKSSNTTGAEGRGAKTVKNLLIYSATGHYSTCNNLAHSKERERFEGRVSVSPRCGNAKKRGRFLHIPGTRRNAFFPALLLAGTVGFKELPMGSYSGDNLCMYYLCKSVSRPLCSSVFYYISVPAYAYSKYFPHFKLFKVSSKEKCLGVCERKYVKRDSLRKNLTKLCTSFNSLTTIIVHLVSPLTGSA